MGKIKISVSLDSELEKQLKEEWSKEIGESKGQNNLSFSQFLELKLENSGSLRPTFEKKLREIWKTYRENTNKKITFSKFLEMLIKKGIYAAGQGL